MAHLWIFIYIAQGLLLLDGTVSARFQVDATGAKSGTYASFYPDGKSHEKGTYRKGCKQGKWTTFEDDAKGHIRIQAYYDKDLLNGSYLLNKDGKPRLKATYAKGELTTPLTVIDS